MIGNRRLVLALLALVAGTAASTTALRGALTAAGPATAAVAALRPPEGASTSAPATTPEPAEQRTEVWLATALSRPLFDARRRPAPAAAAIESGLSPAARGLPRLAGVVVGGFVASAIFEATDGGKPSVLREGDRIGAYVLLSIRPGEATLQGPEGRHVLRPSLVPQERAEQPAFPDAGAVAMPFPGAVAEHGAGRRN